MKLVTAFLIPVMLFAGCATSPTGRSQLMLISPETAIVESRKAYLSTVNQLQKEDKLADDALLADRVQTITGRLVSVAVKQFPGTADWEWSVALIDAPDTVNAWCMAGGRMAVYTGLFEKLKLTDAEFAQIMGHEISHALAHHTAERMSRALATTLGLTVVNAASENSQLITGGAVLAAKLALELPNSRTAEREADRIGMDLATRAGYEPEAAISLWEKMGSLNDSRPPEFLSTHPSPGNRGEQLAQMVPRMRELNPRGQLAPVHPVTIVKQGSGNVQ